MVGKGRGARGYSANLRDSSFFIAARRKREALAAIKDLFTPEKIERLGSYGKYSWVNTGDALAARSLPTMMGEWGWPVELDEDDNVVGIQFDAGDNKLGSEPALWGALAPFVRAGSYLAMVGEDGEHWRWWFDGRNCYRQEARIVYEES